MYRRFWDCHGSQRKTIKTLTGREEALEGGVAICESKEKKYAALRCLKGVLYRAKARGFRIGGGNNKKV